MDPDSVRELVSRREDSDLDFKIAMYEWINDGNNELAKDFMAIANKLGPYAAPGHILIGVEEVHPEKTGRIVGIDPAEHLDDAKMHEKVKYLLNRMPNFSYSAVTVETLSVGVFEIRPGGRPFYPLNSIGRRHRLERFQPLYRAGTATDVASPDQIIAWSRENNPTDLKIKALELEERENRLAIHARVLPPGTTHSGDSATFEFAVVNDGEAPFRVAAARMRWRVDITRLREWLIANGGRLLAPPPTELIENARFERDTLRAGNTSKVTASITGAGLNHHFAQATRTEGAHQQPPFATFVNGQLEVEMQGNTPERRRTVGSDEFPWRA